MKYKRLIDMGIDGFWNDMNEPALFYSEKNLKKTMEELKNMSAKTFPFRNSGISKTL